MERMDRELSAYDEIALGSAFCTLPLTPAQAKDFLSRSWFHDS